MSRQETMPVAKHRVRFSSDVARKLDTLKLDLVTRNLFDTVRERRRRGK
jgi:hypothetical protein